MGKFPRAVVLLSGGVDSTTLLYLMKDQQYTPIALSANYGQKHFVELDHARRTCSALGVEHHYADLTGIEAVVRGSALTGGGPVPEGHYAEETMARTVVPNRNAILLALAFGLAITTKASKVCTAVHAGDHAIYPDCRPEFVRLFEEMEGQAITQEIYGIRCPSLYAPFLLLPKEHIVRIGDRLKVPWLDTWSCYNGDAEQGHCGRCGTCVERIEAFQLADVYDPTVYQDLQFAERVLRGVQTSRR